MLLPPAAYAQTDFRLRARALIAGGVLGNVKFASAMVSAGGSDRTGRAHACIDDLAVMLGAGPDKVDTNTEFGGCVVQCRFPDGVRASIAVCSGAEESVVVRGTRAALHVRQNRLWLEHGGLIRPVGPV